MLTTNKIQYNRRYRRLSWEVVFVLTHYMRDNKITQKALAAKLNKRESVVSRWMSGGHNFTLQTITEIEESLGTTLFELKGLNLPKNQPIYMNQRVTLSSYSALRTPMMETEGNAYVRYPVSNENYEPIR
jgi:transcriptional regulator with XRE-family HTH domain